MRSVMNPNRFLRSISQSYHGNPQPGRVFANRIRRSIFNSTNKARRRVRPFKFFVPRSNPFWRQS